MSISVDLSELAARIDEHGPVGFVVTVGEGGPHVVSARVSLDADGKLVAGAGNTTSANAAARPAVTVMWPAAPARAAYCLLVDGIATVVEGPDRALHIAPSRAVLHRVAGAPGDGPSCITVLDHR